MPVSGVVIATGLLDDLSSELSWAEYGLVLTAVTLGALVQGSIGFGAALVAVPVIAVVVPDALPATVILWAVPLAVAMAVREHHGVDWSGVGWMAVGRLPGAALGAWVVTAVTGETLSVVAGSAVLLAAAMSLLAASVPLTRSTKTAAGFASGLMGTATSIGGPPLALLYQHEDGVILRATLAASFVVGTATSITLLSIAGEVAGWHLLLALGLLPGLGAGLALSRPLTRYLDGRMLRPAVLTFAAAAALVAIANGL